MVVMALLLLLRPAHSEFSWKVCTLPICHKSVFKARMTLLGLELQCNNLLSLEVTSTLFFIFQCPDALNVSAAS